MLRPSSVRSRIGTRISSRNRCGPVISTPRTSELEGGLEQRSPTGSRPCRPCASARPATSPGTATDACPDVEHLRRRVAEVDHAPRPSARCGRDGTAKKQSSSVGSPPASRRSRKPPPAGPVSGPSATNAGERGRHDRVDGVPALLRAPTRRPRRCAGCRRRLLHACRERRAAPPHRRADRTPRVVGTPARRPRAAHGATASSDVRILNGTPAAPPPTSQLTWPLRLDPAVARSRTRLGAPNGPRDSSQASAVGCRDQDAALMQTHLTKRHVAMAGISLALLAVLCLSPSLLGDRVSEALRGLGAADPGLPLDRRRSRSRARAPAARSPGARRSARAAHRCRSSTRRPVTRSAAGSTPSLRPTSDRRSASLCSAGSRTVACWTVSGAAAAVGVTRVVWLGALIASEAPAASCHAGRCSSSARIVAGAVAAAVVSRRLSLSRRGSQQLLARLPVARLPRRAISPSSPAGRSPARSPRSLPQRPSSPRSGSTIRAGRARPRPGRRARGHPAHHTRERRARERGSGTRARLTGGRSRTALSAGIAFGAVELLTGMAIGAAGRLTLAGPWVRPYSASPWSEPLRALAAIAFGATVLLPAVQV